MYQVLYSTENSILRPGTVPHPWDYPAGRGYRVTSQEELGLKLYVRIISPTQLLTITLNPNPNLITRTRTVTELGTPRVLPTFRDILGCLYRDRTHVGVNKF